jgi:recombination protein RecR
MKHGPGCLEQAAAAALPVLFEAPSAERLVAALRKLPGVGKRSAERYALHLLSAPVDEAVELSEAIRQARERIKTCSMCGGLTEVDPCPICADPHRDRSIICVVEQPVGVMAIEKGGSYRGLYHVLHGALSPLDGIGPSELAIGKLIARVETGNVAEVILATNATVEGENTALYLSRQLSRLHVSVSRIAHGVPMGSGLEYADSVTLARALEGRTRL